MKKYFIVILVLLLICSFAGCKSASDVAGEKLAEKAAEELLGDNVDIDGDTITITDENGGKATLGGTEWPEGILASEIPDFKKGVVTYAAESETDCAIQLEEVSKADFEAYFTTVKEAGFTENNLVSSYDGGMFYTALNSEGIIIGLAIDYETNELMITVSQGDSSEG